MNGVPDDAIAQVAGVPPAHRARAIHGLSDMVRSGFTAADAHRLVLLAARQPDPRDALGNLTVAASAMVAQGQPSPAAAQALEDAMVGGHSPLSALDGGPPRGKPDWAQGSGKPEDTPGQGNNK